MCNHCKNLESYKDKASKLVYAQRKDDTINVKDIDGFHKGLDLCILLVASLLEEYDKKCYELDTIINNLKMK